MRYRGVRTVRGVASQPTFQFSTHLEIVHDAEGARVVVSTRRRHVGLEGGRYGGEALDGRRRDLGGNDVLDGVVQKLREVDAVRVANAHAAGDEHGREVDHSGDDDREDRSEWNGSLKLLGYFRFRFRKILGC